MSERSAFDSHAGIHQNRIEPEETSPLEGDFVFVLGSEVQKVVDVAIGDKVQLRFTHDFTATPWAFFAVFMRIRKHSSTPDNYWRLTVKMQAVNIWVKVLDFDFDQDWFPIYIPTPKAAGNRVIDFILERVV